MSNLGTTRPLSLRRCATVAAGLTAAIAAPAYAQTAAEPDVELETLRIEDKAADANPNVEKGAPYKARTSGDKRRVKPIAETPATIAVVTATQIEESGETDLRDVLDNVPGVTVGTGENGNAFGDRYIIRGQEAPSDVFVDGLRDPGMTIRETFAVDQVEITKGPSSAFAGRGAIGGSVNSITKQASSDYDFTRVDVGGGTSRYVRATVDSNWRLSDRAAVRFNLLGAYEGVPERRPADRQRYGGAVSGRFQLSDATSLTVDYYHLTARDKPDLGSYIPPVVAGTSGGVIAGRPWDDIPVYTQDGDFLKSDVNAVTARIEIAPFDGFTVTNLTRYGTTDNGYMMTGLRGGAFVPATGRYTPLTLSTHQGWQEVDYFVNQLNVRGDASLFGMKHMIVAGAEYSDHRVLNGVYTFANTATPNCRVTGTGANNAYCLTDTARAVLPGDVSRFLGRTVTRGPWDSDWRTKTLGVYAMDTVDVTPWLTVNGGIRIDAFDYRNTIRNVTTLVATNYRNSDTLVNGHAAVSVKPFAGATVYVGWGSAREINGGESDLGGSCGYGGVCTPAGLTDLSSGRPERATSWEAGAKFDLFEGRLLIQAAAFTLTKADVFEQGAAVLPDGTTGYTSVGSFNTGRHRVRGIELGVVGNITDRLSGQASFSTLDAKILASALAIPATAPPGSTFVGKRLSNVADTQFTAQLRYQLTDAFAFGGTATHKSAINPGQPDSPASYDFTLNAYRFAVPSSWVFDAFATLKLAPNISARLNVTNVGNADYYLAAYQSGHFVYKGDARRATLTLTGRF